MGFTVRAELHLNRMRILLPFCSPKSGVDQPENGFVQPLAAGLALSPAVPWSSTGNDGGEGSGVLGGVDHRRNVLTSKASKARNALMRWQQSLGSSSCSHGKSLLNWEWGRKLWDRKKCGFRCGLGCPEQCVVHPCSQSCSLFFLLSPVTLSCWRERAQLVDMMGKEWFLSKYSLSSSSESLTVTIQPFCYFCQQFSAFLWWQGSCWSISLMPSSSQSKVFALEPVL